MSVHHGSRRILIHGMAFVFVGLLWGFVIPQTPYPRFALGAHIQFVSNGMLFIVLATVLLALPHNVGLRSTRLIVLSAWLTWLMALSEVANAWWGTTQTLSLTAAEAKATGGSAWQELVVRVTHVVASLAVIVAWALLLVGFLKPSSGASVGSGRIT